MIDTIKKAIESLDALSAKKQITVISHFDTDGITSAAIFSKALKRWQKKFSLKIVKGLESEFIKELPESNILIFLDLASNSLEEIAKKNTEVFILDHHELASPETPLPKNVTMINPVLNNNEPLCTAAICYLFAKTLSPQNTDLSTLAVIGMVGDMHEKHLSKSYDEIIKDSQTTVKKGLLLYPSTRPINKALEYSSNPYIPGVTGSQTGVMELLRDAELSKPSQSNGYKALYELTEEEMSNLITAIMLRLKSSVDTHEFIGNLYLVKFFNKLEDSRELSALINACSRLGSPEVSLGFCLGSLKSKQEAEKLYIKYKQNLVSGLKYVSESEKIQGKMYEIINAKDNIKDTIIGTIASIISHSPSYEKGTVIIALAYNEDKIKVSARIAGREGRNVRDVLHKVVVPLGGEVGGHPQAAGCLIEKDKEELFISELKKQLEIEIVKV
jgi:single-stranded-DNA-specific exonuclease